jgi:hypothetical protein
MPRKKPKRNQQSKRRNLMKKTMTMIMVILLLGTFPVFAETIHNTLGAEFDAPHLVGLKQIHPNLWLGASVSKPLATNLFYSNFAGFEDDKEFLILGKITFDGCILNCPVK